MKRYIDLNSDLGENAGDDESMLKIVSSANIACGAHAGDAYTMNKTVALAVKNNVRIGAHPGFWDRANFGRIPIKLSPTEVYDLIMYQTGALMAFCISHNAPLSYIKPHGALYNMLMVDDDIATGALQAAKALNMPIMGMPYSQVALQCSLQKVDFIAEGFCDRAYEPNGTLMSRSKAGAVYHHDAGLEQTRSMVMDSKVKTMDGHLDITVDSLCVHGDSPDAVSMALDIKNMLQLSGYEVSSK